MQIAPEPRWYGLHFEASAGRPHILRHQLFRHNVIPLYTTSPVDDITGHGDGLIAVYQYH